MSAAEDETLMRRALELARQGWGCTHPDPMVGALIAEDGQIVAEGWHAQEGAACAEKEALAKLGRAPREDATLYVTMEPCPADARTVPGTELIIDAGIKRVVAGVTDVVDVSVVRLRS